MLDFGPKCDLHLGMYLIKTLCRLFLFMSNWPDHTVAV